MANSFGYICDFSDGLAAVKKEEKELGMSLTTFSSAFRRLREKKDLIKTKRKALKMKNKALIIAILLSAFSLSAFAKIDCDDPKNRPRFIGGGYDKRWKKRVRC